MILDTVSSDSDCDNRVFKNYLLSRILIAKVESQSLVEQPVGIIHVALNLRLTTSLLFLLTVSLRMPRTLHQFLSYYSK